MSEIQALGNSLLEWVLALLVGTLVFIALRLSRHILKQRVAVRLPGRARAIAQEVLQLNVLLLFMLSVLAAASFLALAEEIRTLLWRLLWITVFVQIGIWASKLVTVLASGNSLSQAKVPLTSAHALISVLARFLIWALILLLGLDNLGVNITALLAGLGIGGIAVALAVQNVLGDLLASLSIVLDKPFEVGDFIVVGDTLGTVEYIGIKTTRLRSSGGEQIILSNSSLLSGKIQNFKRMYERRVVFGFRLVYNTPTHEVSAVGKAVREIIERQGDTRFDRAHFKQFGDSSLDFEVVYFVLSPQFNLYMDIQERINLELMRYFEGKKIEFAFPSRTLYVVKQEKDEDRLPAPTV